MLTAPRRTPFVAFVLASAMALATSPARADVDVRSLARARAGMPARVISPAPLGVSDRDRFSAIIELPEGEDARRFGLPRLGERFTVLSAPLADLEALGRVHPDWQLSWSPPLRPLLDRASEWTHTGEVRQTTGLTGRGVLIGVVDTGVDLTHADLRNPDGTTRVAYVIDFSKEPLGLYPELESRCTEAKVTCAVTGKTEIDLALSSGDTSTLPADSFGHGTHVASLAASSGGTDGKYVGSAPGSTLVVARVGNGGGDIGDASVLLATQTIFSIAEAEGEKLGLERLPTVVNLSLGSDFGPHDGTSALERGLSNLVGPEHPGRAIVVASGNSAGLATGNVAFPSPLGIHAEVNVPDGPAVRVPIVTSPAPGTGPSMAAAVYVWISYRPGDDLRVGVDRRDGEFVPVQGRGTASSYDETGDVTVTIVNGALDRLRLGDPNANAAVVIIEGTWAREETFAIRLEGKGTAALWVQSAGDLGPGTGGARFPAAFKESTVTSPATAPELIAVGATVNRTEWTDRVDDPITIDSLGSVRTGLLDSIAYFSSAGPTADQRMKPDLVAPGAFVAGAMSLLADPVENASGMFHDVGFCRPVTDCTVIDATHAVAMGTSMAAPIVSGVVALLFERDPSLTQDRIQLLLRAGVRHPEGTIRNVTQMGTGALDVRGTLEVARLMETPERRATSAEFSWLVPGHLFAHPDPQWELPFALLLRDDSGNVADGPEAADVEIDLHNGRILRDAERLAPGLIQFTVAAERDTGGAELEVDVYSGGTQVASRRLPIAVDQNVANEGFAAHGGCAVVGRAPRPASAAAVAALVLGLTVWRGAPSRRGVRRARSRDRRDTSG